MPLDSQATSLLMVEACLRNEPQSFLQAIFVMSTINYSELDYKRPKGVYSYPNWAVAVGWIMAAFAAMWIPIGWIYHIIRYGRDWDTFKRTFKPMGFKPHQMRPKDYGEKTLDTVIRPAQAYTTEAPPPYNGRLEINVRHTHLTCVHIILVRFELLSGHLLGNSCSLG